LFVRNKRSVALTRAGEIFREHARAQVDAQARLIEALAIEERAPTGELRIACTVTACHSILPKLLARCRARYPRIHLQLSTSDAARCMQRLEADEVDVAVVPVPDAPDPDLRFIPLARTELSFIAPSTDKALQRRAKDGGAQWNGMPVILPRRGLERERIDAWFEARHVQPDIYAEVEGNEAILAMVSLGCGIGIVPELVRQDSPLRNAITAIAVEHPPKGFSVALCTKQRTLQRRTMAAFWELAPGAELKG
jgi:LysR family transcriptional regulator, positive regulator for ilvC